APARKAQVAQLNAGLSPCSKDTDCSSLRGSWACSAATGVSIVSCVDSNETFPGALRTTPATMLCVPNSYTALSASFDSDTGSTLLVSLVTIPANTWGDCLDLFDDATCTLLGQGSTWE
ncbi:hypothetical protein HaLaN_19249, partial [Haematococcus lacustris]